MGTESKQLNIGMVTIPFFSPTWGNPSNATIIEILQGACDELFVLTGDSYLENMVRGKKIHFQRVKPVAMEQGWFIRILKYIPLQLAICANLIKVSPSIDIIVFATGGVWFMLPVLCVKMLRKRMVLMVLASEPKNVEQTYSRTFFGKGGAIFYSIFRALESISCTLADKIVVPSERMVTFFQLGKYRKKILIGHYNHYYIPKQFRLEKAMGERNNIVGYVGRLSREKGVVELIRSIPLILSKRNDIRFLIVGDGLLKNELKKEVDEAGCLDKVDFVGAVMPDKVPHYLNQMRFHILPSYTEAGGGTALEAMACGAISIANSVGGIPDNVIDGETGFLLKDNLPETIADKIIEVWGHPDLNNIQKRARIFVEQNLSYEKAVQGWRDIFDKL